MQAITHTTQTYPNVNLNDAIPIRCTAYLDSFSNENIILDHDREWNKSKAPYLFDVTHGFSLGNGQLVEVTEGDYLAKVIIEAPLSHNLTMDDNILLSKGIFLPGKLIRELKSNDILELRYKGNHLRIRIDDSYYDKYNLGKRVGVEQCPFEKMIASIEDSLYRKEKNCSSKPVIVDKEGPRIDLSHSYPHPKVLAHQKNEEKKRMESDQALTNMVREISIKKENSVHFSFNQEKGVFEPVKEFSEQKDLKGLSGSYWCIVPSHRYISIDVPGKISQLHLAFGAETLFVYHVKEQINISTPISLSTKLKTATLINLKEYQISQQDLIEKLPLMSLKKGQLILSY